MSNTERPPEPGRQAAQSAESGKEWFERKRADGSMEPHVTVSDDGCILILDNGWAASFKDGNWTNKIVFSHDQLAEFTPVADQKEIYRILSLAQSALKSSYLDVWPEKA